MRKIIGLIAMAIMAANTSYAEEHPGTVCENNGGRWEWGSNQWSCNMSWKQQKQNEISDVTNKCKNGNMRSCHDFADNILEGREGYPKDISLGIQLMKLSCDGDYSIACMALGTEYYYGLQHVQKNQALAAQYYQKACNAPFIQSLFPSDGEFACYSLGKMYRDGEGVPKNKYRALELFRKSCDLRTEKACVDYNKLVRE
jgi:TPR repeat protein